MSMNQQDEFSPCLIIPCYNHGAMMADVLERLRPFDLPCLVVDDGSDAATADELERLSAITPWMSLTRLPSNQGKGGAVMAALQLAAEKGFTHAIQVVAQLISFAIRATNPAHHLFRKAPSDIQVAAVF